MKSWKSGINNKINKVDSQPTVKNGNFNYDKFVNLLTCFCSIYKKHIYIKQKKPLKSAVFPRRFNRFEWKYPHEEPHHLFTPLISVHSNISVEINESVSPVGWNSCY